MRHKPKEKPRILQKCAVQGCTASGEHKAPSSHHLPEVYQYLCLEHVQEFNRAWDYFDGWSSSQIESFMHDAVYGHRTTWKIGSQPLFTSDMLRERFFRMLGEKPPPPKRRISHKEREALATLNLEPGATPLQVKAQYKKLVKKHHPDVNRGNKASEETFKRITAAYTLLVKLYGSSDEKSHR